MNHLKNILSEAGYSMDELVKCSIFVRDMNDFAAINEIYQGFFTGQSLPARAVVEVSGLPKDVGVEIEGDCDEGRWWRSTDERASLD